MSRDDATQLADTIRDLLEVSKERVKFTLPPSYKVTGRDGRKPLRTGMVALLGTHFGQNWDVLVDTLEVGYNGLLLCEGERYDDGVFSQTKTGMLSNTL